MTTQKNNEYPVITVSDMVLYPGVFCSLVLVQEESIRALEQAGQWDDEILFITQSEGDGAEDIHNPVVTLGKVIGASRMNDQRYRIRVEGLRRLKLKSVQMRDGIIFGQTGRASEKNKLSEDEQLALKSALLDELSAYGSRLERNVDDALENLRGLDSLGALVDHMAMFVETELAKKIELLEELDVGRRAEKLLLEFELEKVKSELSVRVQKRVKEQIDRNQLEYHLNEQIKAIQKELNEINEENDEIENFRRQILEAKMSAEAEKKALAELQKLKLMAPTSSEATVARIYLEWLISYPWQRRQDINYDLENAEAVLNADHYGLEEVKERILEYLAVQKRNKNSKAPILCFVGPPGVGKTSLGKSIATALGRKFDRISLGGMHDEAEIRGHRRTYIGAQPGKIIQKLCKLGTANPLILLDEIDKIGHDHRGDPADALLEGLDPAQNHSFNDHFFETDVDLSQVMFIATANTLDIPAPLLDRMEVIRISGYTTREKEEIAKRYILPRQMAENALQAKELKLDKDIIATIIEDYTREAGVRNLEREIGKLTRKSVRQLEGKAKSIKISRNNLEDFLGVPHYRRSEEDLQPKIGVITGLAWTSVGGELLQIETVTMAGKGKLNYTGQLGDVMKESVQTAHSVVRTYLEQHEPGFDFEKTDLHMHLPEGAIPKDGPSAGIAMATVILSALKKVPVRGDIAMTGEISLHGRVLAIGGLKEKLLAAVRGGIRTVLIPADNVKDLREVPEEVRAALEIIPVKQVEEVFARAFAETLHFALPLAPAKAKSSRNARR